MLQTERQENTPLVTVIVPVYNLGEHVIPCLDSLKGQTYSNLEMVIVDDGSTDDSLAICHQAISGDDRARVVHKENGGLSSARNFGLANAAGDYVMFVDGDDLLDSRAVGHLLTLAQCTGTQLVVCQYRKIDSAGEFDGGPLGTYKLVSGEEQLRKMLLLKGESGSACAKLYSRDLIPLLTFPEGQLFEDFGVEAKVLSNTEKVCVTDAKLYGYVTRKGSITATRDYGDAHVEGMERSLETVRKAVSDIPSLTDALQCFEAFCSLRVASKLDKKTCSTRVDVSQYVAHSKKLCRAAASSPLPTKIWRIRCALFSLSPVLYNAGYWLFSKLTGKVIA